MRKILFLSLLLFLLPQSVFAYQQTEAVCYSQCAAYKFYWQGDFCWDLFTNQCSIGSKDMIKNAISLVKDTAKAMATGKLMTIVDVSYVFKAMAVCKPLIEDCIAPQLNACENTCKTISQTFYAPNLSVGNPYGSAAFHNVYYDEDNLQLVFKVVNNGLGYAWDIDVTASWGHTRNRDKVVSGGRTLFTEKIPELLFLGARVGSPKTPGDYVTDFLIDESNFSKFLSKYKSDANNHYIPPAWYKTVPFTALDGEYTKVILNVDPNKMIPESNEGDNTYILEIDKLPTPISLSVEDLTFQRTNPTSLTEYMVSFELKNSGEENGNARIKWYEGDYESGKNPIHKQNKVIQGLNKASFDHVLNVDVSKGGDSCNNSQKYTLVVFDDEGFIKTRHEFYIPLFAGSITGRAEDLFGKKVVGATITVSTCQSTTVNKYGYYHIKGIPTLGKVTVTVTHPDFSKTETKEVELKFNDSKDKCRIEGLTHSGVNFILKDQDVIFTVTVKDSLSNPINAHVLAVNSDFRKEVDINGTGPMSQLQPGKYLFTVSAPGYKTIRQDVNAVPENNNLEFVLEKLNGRPDDTGLSLIPPRLLWKKTLGTGEKIIGNMTGTKNGKLLVAHVADNKSKTNKLFFLDFLTGNQIKEASIPYSLAEQRHIGLDASYDGGTVGLFVAPGSGPTDQEGIIKIFNATGNEIGATTIDKKMSVYMDVSQDGFYLCPNHLFDKGLHKYTRHETEGIGDDDYKRNPAGCGYFLRNNNIITSCKEGLCEKTIADQHVRVIGDITKHTAATKYDSTVNDGTIVVRTSKNLYYFGGSSWNKEIKSDNDYKSVAVSSGGMYAIVTAGKGSSHLLKLNVFNNAGEDKTPDFPYKNVKFVFANDKGLFFTQIVLNQVELYQIGEYDSEYKPTEVTPTTIPQWIDGISYYSRGQFFPLRDQYFAGLDPRIIYRADKSIKLDIVRPFTSTSLGTLSITKDSLFAVDYRWNPILIKGQMTANFGAPATVYAIKFDRDWTGLFEEKLSKFIRHQLPADEYFIVQNIHTKFVVKNNSNQFNVAVEKGEVQVLAGKIEKTITSGKQITIDAQNNIKESVYLNRKIYAIIAGVLLLISGVLLFIYRKSKVGGMIISILKKIAILFWRYSKVIIKWLWKNIKKLLKIK